MTETIDTAQPGPFVALWQNYCDQKETISQLRDALAAAEARNATLTEEAARAERNRDMWKDQCAAQAQQIAQARAEAVQVKVLHETIIDAARRAMDEGEDALDTINVPSHHAAALSLALDDYDAAIQARAAASISTKGDGS